MEALLYTVPEVAEILKTNENYVYKLIRSGLLPCMQLGRYKIRRQAIVEFLEKYEGKNVSDPTDVKEIDFNE